jgi:hypothetical protein
VQIQHPGPFIPGEAPGSARGCRATSSPPEASVLLTSPACERHLFVVDNAQANVRTANRVLFLVRRLREELDTSVTALATTGSPGRTRGVPSTGSPASGRWSLTSRGPTRTG